MVSGAIPGQNFPSITTEKGKQRLIDAIPDVGFYRTPDRKLSFNRPEMNTISLLADPNIGPQNIVAVPLGGGNTGGERTGLMGPTQQPETPSEQYMREMKTEAPIPTPSPDAALKLGLIGGEAVAQDRNQGNLLSGLLGDIDYKGILNQLVKTFQRPEMLTPGVNALTSFGMAGAGLNQAEIAGAKEQAQLDQANQQQALENEYRRTRDTRDAARLTLAEENAERLKAPTITKAKLDAYTAVIKEDKITKDIMDNMYGTAVGRFFGTGINSKEAAVAAEAIVIQHANPRMSAVEVVREAAKNVSAKASSSAPVPTKPDAFATKS